MGNQCCDITSCRTNRHVRITRVKVGVRCVFSERLGVLQMFGVDSDTGQKPKAEQQRRKVCRWKGPRCSWRQGDQKKGDGYFLKQWSNVLGRGTRVGDENMLTLDRKRSTGKDNSFFINMWFADLFCNEIPRDFVILTFFSYITQNAFLSAFSGDKWDLALASSLTKAANAAVL